MKNRIFFCLYLIIIISFFSCARKGAYIRVGPPSPKESVTPSEQREKGAPDSYVVNGERYYPLPNSTGFVQTGKASWYGKEFQGRSTASGEIYNMNKNTAAHKTLPFGTHVEVLNLSNNRRTVVRINDRGPFVNGRIIDLSYSSAKEILLIGPGVTDVKITALGKEIRESNSEEGSKPILEYKEFLTGEFTIQVGAFKNESNALQLAERLRVLFDYVNITKYVDENNTTLFRLHVSKSDTLTKAGEIEKRLEDMGFSEAFIVRI